MYADNELNILIIDDNPEIQNDFKKILFFEKENNEEFSNLDKALFGENKNQPPMLPKFHIDTASQGMEGVEMVSNAIKAGIHYALVFVDIRMPPGIDGLETIKKILELDKNIQIVICTAYSDYTWEKIIEDLGQRENLFYLKKPFDHISVRQLAVALTKKWQLTQQTSTNTKIIQKKVKEQIASLEFQALHDPLTKLPNRKFLLNFVNDAIKNSKQRMSKIALMFFDLDRFKLINDNLGHAAGDDLLIKVSYRIQKSLRGNDFFSRLSGDEFVLVLLDFSSIDTLKKIATNILDILREEFEIETHKVIISASIGISIFPYDAKTADELIKSADIAMYHAKKLGGNQFQFYEENLNYKIVKRRDIETDLYSAIKNKEFFLCYQPQYDFSEKKILSVEALIRWRHPKLGILLPIDFIPFAEDLGIFPTLWKWIIKEACEQNVRWQKKGYAPIKVAINIIDSQFKEVGLLEEIDDLLKETGLNPEYLEFEISENIVMNNSNVINTIKKLKVLGVTITISNFGSCYSTLGYLQNIPLDKLKIDKSFIKSIAVNACDEVIIKSIIAIAGCMQLNVSADGIETKNQLNFLESNSCNAGQGFYFNEPLDPNELEKFFK